MKIEQGKNSVPLNKLQFSKDGSHIAVGDVEGNLTILKITDKDIYEKPRKNVF